ncbi:hypothetical protein BV20DRAFT_916322, partial [Pilatotrama ljubarskyi]
TRDVPLHKIGNVCFASFGERHQVRIFFPKLLCDVGLPKVSQEDLADLYNKGILPTVRRLAPHMTAHWPPSYGAAMDLGRDHRGILHFSKVDIPEELLPDFAELLLEALTNHSRLKGGFFMVEMRGTKGMYTYTPGDDRHRRTAFNLLVEPLRMQDEADNLDNWYVDVGLEVARPGHVLQWQTTAHHRLLRHALPSLSDSEINALLEGSNFSVDVSGHLFELAGFRANPGARGRADKVVHLNVYTTDKAVTYQLHAGAFSQHPTTCLYPGKIQRLLGDIETIARMFARC